MISKISVLEAILALLSLILLKILAYLSFADYISHLSFLFDTLIYGAVFTVLKFRSKIKVDVVSVDGSVYITCILMGLAIFLLVEIGSYIEVLITEGNQAGTGYFQNKRFLTSNLKTQVISIVFVVPVFEELIFRGLILNSFLDRFSIKKSILLSAFLFWIGHFGITNISEALAIFILGVVTAWVYYRSRNIYACILIHFGFNVSNYFIRYIYYSIDFNRMNNIVLLSGMLIVCLTLLSLGILNVKSQ